LVEEVNQTDRIDLNEDESVALVIVDAILVDVARRSPNDTGDELGQLGSGESLGERGPVPESRSAEIGIHEAVNEGVEDHNPKEPVRHRASSEEHGNGYSGVVVNLEEGALLPLENQDPRVDELGKGGGGGGGGGRETERRV